MASDGRTPPLHTARSVERTPPCCSAERQSCRRDASRHHTQRTQQAGENARTRCRVMSDVSPSLSTFALSLPHTLALRHSHLILSLAADCVALREKAEGERVWMAHLETSPLLLFCVVDAHSTLTLLTHLPTTHPSLHPIHPPSLLLSLARLSEEIPRWCLMLSIVILLILLYHHKFSITSYVSLLY